MIKKHKYMLSVVVAVVIIIIVVISLASTNNLTSGFSSMMGIESSTTSDTGRGLLDRNSDARYNKLVNNMASYGSYEDVMKYEALEPSIFESHHQYTKDIGNFNLGPGKLAERSDSNDLVKHIGVRRADYYGVNLDDSARQVPSEIQDQMPRQNKSFSYLF